MAIKNFHGIHFTTKRTALASNLSHFTSLPGLLLLLFRLLLLFLHFQRNSTRVGSNHSSATTTTTTIIATPPKVPRQWNSA